MSDYQVVACEDAHQIIQWVGEALATVSPDGQCSPMNAAFQGLSPEIRGAIQDYVSTLDLREPHSQVFDRVEVDVKPISTGAVVIARHLSRQRSQIERTLTALSEAFESADNLYQAAARVIGESLGWRWVAITQFVDARVLEVMAFWDSGQFVDNFTYDIAGTPCQFVVDTERFTVFTNLEDSFPDYKSLQEMGAKVYAGLIFRASDGTPLGHVMALHDDAHVDISIAQDIINACTLALGAQFKLHSTHQRLLKAESKAYSDALTGIANRMAYNKRLAEITSTPETYEEAALAIVDLDNLKEINDTLGHLEGDRFIQLAAIELRKIGRHEDFAYRIGGDEFAVVFEKAGPIFKAALLNRLDDAMNRISAAIGTRVDASIGVASLAEVGDVEERVKTWVELADRRMYNDKITKQKTYSRA